MNIKNLNILRLDKTQDLYYAYIMSGNLFCVSPQDLVDSNLKTLKISELDAY